MKSLGQLLTIGLILFWYGGHAQLEGQTTANTIHVCYQNEVTFTDTVYGQLNYPSDSSKFCSCILTPSDDFNGTVKVTLVESVKRVGADTCSSKLQILTPRKTFRLLCPYIDSFFDLPLSSKKRMTFLQNDGSMKFTFKVIQGGGNMKLSCSGDPLPTTTTKNPTTKSSVPTQKSTSKSSDPTQEATTKSSDPTEKSTTLSSDSTKKSTSKSSDPTQKTNTETSNPTQKSTAKSTDPTQKSTTKSTDPSQKSTSKSSDPTQQATTKPSDQTQESTTITSAPTPKSTTKISDSTQQSTTKSPDPTPTTKSTHQSSTTCPIHNPTVPKTALEELYAAVFKVCICKKLREEYDQMIPKYVDSNNVVSMDSYMEAGSILLAKLLFSRTQ